MAPMWMVRSFVNVATDDSGGSGSFSGKLLHPGAEVDLSPPSEHIHGSFGRGEHVTNVSRAVATGDSRRSRALEASP